MASPASPDSARAYYNETIDLENQSVPFTKTDPKAKNRCRADRRAPPSKTPREATAPPSQNKKAKFVVLVIISIIIIVVRRRLSSKTHRYVLDRFQRRHQGTQRQDAFLRRLAIVRPTVERKPNAVGVLQVGPRHRRRHVGIHHSGLLFF